MAEKNWDRFSANAIFLQPTWTCKKNCQGCYVKEKESKFGSDEMDTNIWLQLLYHIKSNGTKLRASQITLALDTLPKTAARYKMEEIASEYFATISQHYKVEDPDTEFHITCNSVNDLKEYNERADGLHLCSISHLNNADEIGYIKSVFPNAKINYNVMSSDFVKQVNARGIDHVKSIVRNVDSVYLLLSKAPMGQEGHDFSGFFQALETLKQFKNPKQEVTEGEACAVPDLASKFVMDGCMQDSRKFIKTKFGCSSNVSRFQIWPDGRVTGCAYNSHNQYGKAAESFEDVLENLHDAKNRYEFSSCSIPKGLVEYPKKKSLQVVNV